MERSEGFPSMPNPDIPSSHSEITPAVREIGNQDGSFTTKEIDSHKTHVDPYAARFVNPKLPPAEFSAPSSYKTLPFSSSEPHELADTLPQFPQEFGATLPFHDSEVNKPTLATTFKKENLLTRFPLDSNSAIQEQLLRRKKLDSLLESQSERVFSLTIPDILAPVSGSEVRPPLTVSVRVFTESQNFFETVKVKDGGRIRDERLPVVRESVYYAVTMPEGYFNRDSITTFPDIRNALDLLEGVIEMALSDRGLPIKAIDYYQYEAGGQAITASGAPVVMKKKYIIDLVGDDETDKGDFPQKINPDGIYTVHFPIKSLHQNLESMQESIDASLSQLPLKSSQANDLTTITLDDAIVRHNLEIYDSLRVIDSGGLREKVREVAARSLAAKNVSMIRSLVDYNDLQDALDERGGPVQGTLYMHSRTGAVFAVDLPHRILPTGPDLVAHSELIPIAFQFERSSEDGEGVRFIVPDLFAQITTKTAKDVQRYGVNVVRDRNLFAYHTMGSTVQLWNYRG